MRPELEGFRNALLSLQALRDELPCANRGPGKLLTEQHLEAVAVAVKAKTGRRPPRDSILSAGVRHLGREEMDRIGQPFHDQADAITKVYLEQEQRAKAIVDAAAQHVRPMAGELWVQLTEVWESTYRSQGFGSYSYAQKAAENAADVARFYDIPTRVDLDTSNGRGLARFPVMVQVDDPLDAELLRRLPGPPLREWVRLCWKRGVNPRVFNPFLPPGYEEREGLDFHGNDLRPAQGKGGAS